ncbi:retrovirus-related Pol polyprotein from transposon opus [Trichonephila clavipes]|nr:retrovirus-related Pol polyprotein from transposon opus [Trichonephila clavipes]
MTKTILCTGVHGEKRHTQKLTQKHTHFEVRMFVSAQKASEVADRILEVTPVQVSAVSKYSSVNSDDSSESKLLKELKLLRQEVKELRRSRSFSRNRFDSRNRGKRKRERAGVAATYALPSTSCRLFVRVRKSNICFLVDTGSDCSILPSNKTLKQPSPVQTFIAAKGTPIQVYGRQLMSLDLGLRRNFVFPFFICNVFNAIIGADFLHYFNIKPDLRNRTLFDVSTKLNCHCIIRNSNIFSIKTHVIDNDFSKLLNDFPNIVKAPCANQTVKHNVVCYIDTFGPPVCAKPRRMAPDRLKIAKMEFQHMLDLGHMRPSSSNYSSPLHMVPKKESNDWRPVGDFRALNAQTKKDKYPIPSILDFTSDLHGVKIFTHIDLVKAFHQIPIASEDIHKTAICTLFGLFESTRMQFGLCNAASTFQRFIDEVTRGLKVDSLKFLGFQVFSEGISPLPDRVYAIQKFPRPNTLTQLRRFLRMYNFYRRFIPKAAHILAPLITFLEGHTNKKKSSRPSKNLQTPLEWTEEAENSFTAAKTALADATLLKHPIPGATLSVWTDAHQISPLVVP